MGLAVVFSLAGKGAVALGSDRGTQEKTKGKLGLKDALVQRAI